MRRLELQRVLTTEPCGYGSRVALRLPRTTASLLRRVRALRTTHNHASLLLDRLERLGEIRLRALVADHDFPEPADRFGDFHRQPERAHLLDRQPHVLHH